LKKREMGLEHEPITIKRIDEVMRKVRQDLERCWHYPEVHRGEGDALRQARLERADLEARRLKPDDKTPIPFV